METVVPEDTWLVIAIMTQAHNPRFGLSEESHRFIVFRIENHDFNTRKHLRKLGWSTQPLSQPTSGR